MGMKREVQMYRKDHNRGDGLHGRVTGTVAGEPLFRMVKNGTVPMLGITVSFPEHAGTTSVCRVTLFGNEADALADHVRRGLTVTAEGTVRLNSWEKNGETKHGLAMLANKIDVGGGSPSGGACARSGGNGSQRARQIVIDNDADLF